MRKLTLAAAAALLAVPALAWNLPDMNRTIDQTNFVVGDGAGNCSGTLIDVERRLIVTAWHCVKDRIDADERVKVAQSWIEGRDPIGAVSYVSRVVAHRQDRDIAILQLTGRTLVSVDAVELLPEGGEVTRGEVVWAVGNPGMLEASVTQGIVSSVSRVINWNGSKDVPVIQYSAETSGGSSGGAIFNDQGFYIATHVGGAEDGSFKFGIPVDWLHALLRELEAVA
jgi:S1-C subfamily serine protease